MFRTAALATVIACLTLGSSGAHAAEIGGVAFDDKIVIEGEELTLRGLGRVYYLRWFEVYVGGVYLPEGTSGGRVLDDVAKRLELRYSRKIRADQLVEAGDEFLRRNLNESEFAEIDEPLKEINALYKDVDEGDRYTLTYVPGVGTELALNGVRQGVVAGARFAELYLSIWLGQRPLSVGFKDAVLTGAEL